MVVIAIIALIQVIRMAKHQRTPPGVRRDQQSRFRTEWMPALVIYPVGASR